MHEVDLAIMAKDIKFIRKCLEGNGKPGLIDRVTYNTYFRYTIIGGLTLLASIASYIKFT